MRRSLRPRPELSTDLDLLTSLFWPLTSNWGLEDRVRDTGPGLCLIMEAVMSDSVLRSGRFIDLARWSSPGEESRELVLVLTSRICLLDCS